MKTLISDLRTAPNTDQQDFEGQRLAELMATVLLATVGVSAHAGFNTHY